MLETAAESVELPIVIASVPTAAVGQLRLVCNSHIMVIAHLYPNL